MEHAACNVIYVNWRAKDQVIQRGSNAGAVSVTLPNGSDSTDSKLDAEINSSIESILSAFTTGIFNSLFVFDVLLTQCSSHLFFRLFMFS